MSFAANNTRELILLNASTSTGSCIIMPTHNATKSKISCRTQDIDCSKEMTDTQVVNKKVNDVPLNERLSSGILAGGSMSSSIRRREREIKKQKEKFLMFTRVLIKYLEQVRISWDLMFLYSSFFYSSSCFQRTWCICSNKLQPNFDPHEYLFSL